VDISAWFNHQETKRHQPKMMNQGLCFLLELLPTPNDALQVIIKAKVRFTAIREIIPFTVTNCVFLLCEESLIAWAYQKV
jgi:hypothetical protein